MEKNSTVLHVNDQKNRSKKKEYRKIRINLYLTPSELADYAQEAQKVGCRPFRSKAFVKKPHGFADEFEPNTTGIAKFIRTFLFPSWMKHETERLIKKRELEKHAKELGLEIKE